MLQTKHCVPCEGGVPPVAGDDLARLLREVPAWEVRNGRLHRHFAFRGFPQAMQFVNAMADVAEAEGHHPDFAVHYREVDVEIWTHAIGGLSENDFILAARIDEVAGKS